MSLYVSKVIRMIKRVRLINLKLSLINYKLLVEILEEIGVELNVAYDCKIWVI